MSLSVAPMTMEALAAYLVSTGEYATIAEAMAAFNIVITDGVGATGTALAVTGGPASTAIGTVGETALELAARSQLQATGMGVATSGISLFQGVSGFSVSALLKMPVGVVGAALVPYYGVKFGRELYDFNPEFWTKLSIKLLPFCYPGTTDIPTWAEVAEASWVVSVAKGILDAIKELLDDEKIPINGDEGDVTSVTIEGTTFPVASEWTTTGGYHLTASHSPAAWYNSTGEVSRAWGSAVPQEGFPNVYYGPDGSPVYWGSEGTLGHTTNLPDTRFGPGYIAWNIVYGDAAGGRHYQPGISFWDGDVPTEIPQAKPAVIGLDGQGGAITTPTVPLCPPIIIIPDPIVEPQPVPQTPPQIIPFPWPKPATVPEEEPWPEVMPWPLPATEPNWWPVEIPYPDTYPYQYPTQDPELQPDPTTITDPKKQVDPYIWPSPFPYELPVPETEPTTNPKADPSKPTRPSIKIDTLPPSSPTNPDEPPPSGISPVATFPTTSLPFDISQNVGLVTVYHPTASQLYAFERWLWVTYADATIDKIFNNPFDGVISLFELYCTPTDVSTQTIRSGFLNSGISSAVISRYTEIDCGTLGIPEYYGNYFDYSPYSKAHIYLPFIGIQELNVDDIVGHAVNVKYRIDEYNGSCIAMITVAKVTEVAGEQVEYSNTTYQFSGNCSVELPFAGGTQAAIKAGMMQADAWQTAANVSAGVNLVGGVASILGAAAVPGGGGIGMAMGGVSQGLSSIGNMYSGQAQYISNMLSGKATVQKSGGFGSSHGALGIKTPFITVTRPKQIQVANYNEEYGYPAHKLVYVGDCTGFLRCREVHVLSATATDEEKNAIEAMLKSGIYVTE